MSLLNILNDDNDEHDQPIKQSLYYSDNDFISTLSDSINPIAIVSLNCQSIRSKFDDILILIEKVFKTLNLLKLPDLYRLQLYKLYYKMKKQTVPSYFKNILTEVIIPYNTRNSFLKFPIARHEYTRKTCLYQIINYVNYPPSNPLIKLRTDMSDTHSITGFVLYHKNRTLESYSLHCRILDCYVCRVCHQ